jgi:DNA-binding beta-propeller fold protein YncE
MRAFIRIFVIVTGILIMGLLPMVSFGAEALKFRHVRSIYSDEQSIALRQPEGVAGNDASQLIVADTGNGRLLRYTFENRELASKIQEIRAPQILYPIKLEFNSRGEIYVLDRKRLRIVHLSPQGVFKKDLDLKAPASPAQIVPRSFHIDRKDNIYVLDVLSGRVLVLDPAGQFSREIKFPQGRYFFSDLAVDFKGDVFLVDGINARVFRAAKGSTDFAPLTKSLKQFMRFPTSITTDGRGIIYLTDRNGGKVVVLGQDGSYLGRLSGMGWKEGFLNYPSQVSINGKGEIFIADTLNNRVQIFTIIE